jgi:hypothetical protein
LEKSFPTFPIPIWTKIAIKSELDTWNWREESKSTTTLEIGRVAANPKIETQYGGRNARAAGRAREASAVREASSGSQLGKPVREAS